MQLHDIQSNTARPNVRRVGRGGKRGKTSGRGMKGQTARAGNKTRPEMRDIIKRYPKLRGHGKNRALGVNEERVRPIVVSLSKLEVFENGADVTPQTLVAEGIVAREKGSIPKVKILGNGTVSKKLNIAGCEVSASVRTLVEKAGGSVTI